MRDYLTLHRRRFLAGTAAFAGAVGLPEIVLAQARRGGTLRVSTDQALRSSTRSCTA